MKRFFEIRFLLGGLLLLLAAGCAHPLVVTYESTDWEPPFVLPDGRSIAVMRFVDARSGVGSGDGEGAREIGEVKAVISDMMTTKLVLSEDVAELTTRAFVTELTSAGFIVTDDPHAEEVIFVIVGEVRKFRYDILSRDEIDVELGIRITEKERGIVLWSGELNEVSDRFVGIMGNNRASISAYINDTLARLVRRAIEKAEPKVRLMSFEKPPFDAPAATEGPLKTGLGRLVITTTPPLSKIYIGDVYYGLSPLTVEIEPGIYDMRFMHKEFVEEAERVAVRDGRTTELDVELERRSFKAPPEPPGIAPPEPDPEEYEGAGEGVGTGW